MKSWTLEELYELWRNRGYSKREAMKMAENDFNEMHRKKSDEGKYEIMLDMTFC